MLNIPVTQNTDPDIQIHFTDVPMPDLPDDILLALPDLAATDRTFMIIPAPSSFSQPAETTPQQITPIAITTY